MVGIFDFSRGKLSWEESFSPHPFQRTLDVEFYFFAIIIAFDGRANSVRTAPTQESFGQAFSKACGFGQSP